MIAVRDDKGNAKVYAELVEIEGKTRKAVRQAWFGFGKDLKKTANSDILDKASKAGRIYWIRSKGGGRRRRHRASAPGQTHANMYGDLRKSLGWKVHGFESMEFGYGVSPRRDPTPDYDKYVEQGTSRMAARPTLRNTVEKEQNAAESHFIVRMAKEFSR